MNEQDFCDSLMQLLSSVLFHHDLAYDLLSLMAKSGQETKFLAALITNLHLLRIHGTDAVYVKPRAFEKLSHETDLYSMRVKTSQINCRILYAFSFDRPVLLHGFIERQGHGRTDYSSAIPAARDRMKEWRTQHE